VQSVFFILLVVVAAYVLLQSPFFQVKKIVVSGNRQLKSEEIISYSGITTGANIFKLNLSQSEQKLKMVPLLKDAALERKLPDKIVIHVVERKAVALIAAKDNFIKVDADGVYLQKGDIASSALPVITGLNVALDGPGKPVKSQYLPVALEALAKLPKSLILNTSEIHINDDGQLWLYTMNGVQGRLGLPKEIEYKGIVFQQVLNSLKQTGGEIQYIDLSNPRVPVVKYSKQPQEGQQ